jgi:hypothetical protein
MRDRPPRVVAAPGVPHGEPAYAAAEGPPKLGVLAAPKPLDEVVEYPRAGRGYGGFEVYSVAVMGGEGSAEVWGWFVDSAVSSWGIGRSVNV